MSPDHLHTSRMNENLRRNNSINREDQNTKRSSIISNTSNSSSSSTKDHIFPSPPRRSSNINFLDKIKYFERKTDYVHTESKENSSPKVEFRRKLSLKKVIHDIRAQFPEEELDVRNGTPTKRNSKEANHSRLSYNEEITKTENMPVPERKPLKKTEHIQAVSGKRTSVEKTEYIDEAPEKRLSVKKTIQDAREQFTKQNPITPTRVIDSNYIDSKCAQFFSTSNTDILSKEMTIQRDFRVLLKGFLCDNSFYPAELDSHQMRYHIHNFFDYDLSPFEYD